MERRKVTLTESTGDRGAAAALERASWRARFELARLIGTSQFRPVRSVSDRAVEEPPASPLFLALSLSPTRRTRTHLRQTQGTRLFNRDSFAEAAGVAHPLTELIAHRAIPLCPKCRVPAVPQSAEAEVDRASEELSEGWIAICGAEIPLSELPSDLSYAAVDGTIVRVDDQDTSFDVDVVRPVAAIARMPLHETDVQRMKEAAAGARFLVHFPARGEPIDREYELLTGFRCPRCGESLAGPNTISWFEENGEGVADRFVFAGTPLDVLQRTRLEALAPVLEAEPLDGGPALVRTKILARLDALAAAGFESYELNEHATDLSPGEWLRLRLALLLESGASDGTIAFDELLDGFSKEERRRILPLIERLGAKHSLSFFLDRDCASTALFSDIERFVREGTQAPVKDRGGEAVPRAARTSLVSAEHELQSAIEAALEPGTLSLLTGPSGSGKSRLMKALAERAAAQPLRASLVPPRVVAWSSQEFAPPPLATLASESGVHEEITRLLLASSEGRRSGLAASDLSPFRSPHRCPDCQGTGMSSVADDSSGESLELRLSPLARCATCAGMRFDRKVNALTYREKNLGEILSLPVDDALSLFWQEPKLVDRLTALRSLSLGAVQIGALLSLLPHAPRLLFSFSLAALDESKRRGKKKDARALFLFDQPLLGLSGEEVALVIDRLSELVERGDTVWIVDHTGRLTLPVHVEIALRPDPSKSHAENLRAVGGAALAL